MPTSRPVSASASAVVTRMHPADANAGGSVHGGVIMKLCDEAAGTCASRHARGPVVTAKVSEMTFEAPVEVGELLTVKTSVNAVFGSSMEVGARVEAEDLTTGDVRHTMSAYFLMVGMGEDGPQDVPELELDTPDAERRNQEAQARRG